MREKEVEFSIDEYNKKFNNSVYLFFIFKNYFMSYKMHNLFVQWHVSKYVLWIKYNV